MNFIGTSVTDLIDRAAPPLASPSSLVKITPVSFYISSKVSATFTASCPVIASRTRRTSDGSSAS